MWLVIVYCCSCVVLWKFGSESCPYWTELTACVVRLCGPDDSSSHGVVLISALHLTTVCFISPLNHVLLSFNTHYKLSFCNGYIDCRSAIDKNQQTLDSINITACDSSDMLIFSVPITWWVLWEILCTEWRVYEIICSSNWWDVKTLSVGWLCYRAEIRHRVWVGCAIELR